MLNEIKANSNFMRNQSCDKDAGIKTTPYFSENIAAISNNDKFEKNTDILKQQIKVKPDKEKSKLELALIGVSGISVTMFAITRARIGRALKLVGKKAPVLIGGLGKISDVASKDGMTDLFNKSVLLATLAKDFKIAVKKGKNYSVAMLDMDNFKAFNEVFDHDTGDKVLKRISANIQKVIQKHKAEGFRYGGEEFVITLPNYTSESAKKVVEEIAEAIKKDEEIQGLIPAFKEKAQKDIDFISPKLSQLDTIFLKLRKGKNGGDCKKLADEIISLVDAHIEKYEPSDTKALKEFIEKIKSAKNNELSGLLQINTKLNGESTLGKELDKIYTQYDGIKNDLQKWIGHVNRHGMFTVSGGVVNYKDSKAVIKEGEHLVKIADAALKSAKENGKNIIISANDELIKRIIEKINKKNAS